MNLEEAKFTAGPYVEKIAMFQTAQEIRGFLASEGIQARMGCPHSCAIAEYVHKASGVEVSVGKAVFVGHVPVYENVVDGDDLILRNSGAMEDFILNFDTGLYPELVAAE